MILTSAGSKIAHLIARKHYDEKITTIHTCKSYYDVISREQNSNQQQIQKNKRIKRILVVDDEYDVSLTMKLVLEESGFEVDSFTDASEALENFTTGLKIAYVIGKAVWRQRGDIRDVISIGKLVRKNDGPEEVEQILGTMIKYGNERALN
jgi:hypothetical protein